MDLGSLELQIFVSLTVVLGGAFVALVCDYLKGNNEQLREHNIELRVRKEEQERRLLLDPAGFLGQMLPAQNQNVARQAPAAARPAAPHEVMQSFAKAEALAEADERAARLHARTGDDSFETADVPPMTQSRGGRKGSGRANNRGNRKDGEKYADWVRPEVIARVARRAEASAAYSSDIRDDLDASREESLPAPLNAPEVPDIRQDLPVRAKVRKEPEPVLSAPKQEPKIAATAPEPVVAAVSVETRPMEPVAVEPVPAEALPERLSPEDSTKLQREIERVAYLERQPLAPAPGTILRPLTVPTLKLEEEIQRVAEQEPVAAQPSPMWHSALLDEVIANSSSRSPKKAAEIMVPVVVEQPVVVERVVPVAVVAEPVAEVAEETTIEVVEEVVEHEPVADPGPNEITLDPNGYMEAASVAEFAPAPVVALLPEVQFTALTPLVEETPNAELESVGSELSIEVAAEPSQPAAPVAALEPTAEVEPVFVEPESVSSESSIEVVAEPVQPVVPVWQAQAEPALVAALEPIAEEEPVFAEPVLVANELSIEVAAEPVQPAAPVWLVQAEPEPIAELVSVSVEPEPVGNELSIEVAAEPVQLAAPVWLVQAEPEPIAEVESVAVEPEPAGTDFAVEIAAVAPPPVATEIPLEAPTAEPELVFAEADAVPMSSADRIPIEAVEPPPMVFLIDAEEPVVPFAQVEAEPEIAEPVSVPMEFAQAPEPPPFVFDIDADSVPAAVAESEPPVMWLELPATERLVPAEDPLPEPAPAEQIYSYYNFQPRASVLAGMGISPAVEYLATIPALEPPLASIGLSNEPALTAFLPTFAEESETDALPGLLPVESDLTWEPPSTSVELEPLPAFASVEPPPFWVDEPVAQPEPTPVTALTKPIDIDALRQPEPVAQAPAPITIPDLLLPTGMHDLSTWSRLMSLPNPMTGILFVISLQPSEKAAAPAPKGSSVIDENGPAIDKLMASFVREGDFGTRISETEWVFIYSNDVAGFNQRRVGLISEKLWDFQLRHLGMANVSFKWGAIDVQSEPVPAALEAARDRMNQTRRTRKLPGVDAASPRRVVNG